MKVHAQNVVEFKKERLNAPRSGNRVPVKGYMTLASRETLGAVKFAILLSESRAINWFQGFLF